MPNDLFAGIMVRDYGAALPWYERLLGVEPSFLPTDTEAVWEVAEHRYVYIVENAERAGHSVLLVFVDDLDAVISAIAQRGIEPASEETYENGVRKVVFRDPDGNEFAYGGGPA